MAQYFRIVGVASEVLVTNINGLIIFEGSNGCSFLDSHKSRKCRRTYWHSIEQRSTLIQHARASQMRKIRMSTCSMRGSAATSWKVAGSIPDDAIGIVD
jgi:hypothetical protein